MERPRLDFDALDGVLQLPPGEPEPNLEPPTVVVNLDEPPRAQPLSSGARRLSGQAAAEPRRPTTGTRRLPQAAQAPREASRAPTSATRQLPVAPADELLRRLPPGHVFPSSVPAERVSGTRRLPAAQADGAAQRDEESVTRRLPTSLGGSPAADEGAAGHVFPSSAQEEEDSATAKALEASREASSAHVFDSSADVEDSSLTRRLPPQEPEEEAEDEAPRAPVRRWAVAAVAGLVLAAATTLLWPYAQQLGAGAKRGQGEPSAASGRDESAAAARAPDEGASKQGDPLAAEPAGAAQQERAAGELAATAGAQPEPAPAPAQPAAEQDAASRRVAALGLPTPAQPALFPAIFPLNESLPLGVRAWRVAALAKLLRGCEGGVRITGHSCTLGTPEAREAVALARAEAVAEALEAAGLPRAALHTASAGSREPVASNTSAVGRARNRRVSLFCEEAAPTPRSQQP